MDDRVALALGERGFRMPSAPDLTADELDRVSELVLAARDAAV